MKRSGFLAMIFGPMGGGKSLTLMRYLHMYQQGWTGKIIMIVKRNSMRFSDEVRIESRSNASLRKSPNHIVLETDDLETARNENHLLFAEPAIVAIDEAHFFSGLYKNVADMLVEGHIVLVAGLVLSWKGAVFHEDGIQSLLQLAPEVAVNCPAVCGHCFAPDAVFNAKRAGKSNQTYEVGSEEEYAALCRKCWLDRANLGFMES